MWSKFLNSHFPFTLEYVPVKSEEDIILLIVECGNLPSNKLKIMGEREMQTFIQQNDSAVL